MRAVVALLAVLALACEWYGWVPAQRPPAAAPALERVPLEIAAPPQRERLDCPSGRCNATFRVLVSEPGTLRVTVTPVHDAAGGPDAVLRVILEDPVGRVMQLLPPQTRPPFVLEGEVSPGPYQVLVQSIGGEIEFEIDAALEPSRTPQAD